MRIPFDCLSKQSLAIGGQPDGISSTWFGMMFATSVFEDGALTES